MPESGHEAVVRNFPLLRVSLQYVDGQLKARLTAMYGLLACLEDCFTRASDPAVTSSKLGWWYEELSHAGKSQGTHPVTASLLDTGALACWRPGLLEQLFQQAMLRIDHAGLRDEVELRTEA